MAKTAGIYMMKVSQHGIHLIAQFEGLRLEAYRDIAGVPTIGYGSTKGVKMGMKLASAKEARQLLEKEVTACAAAVDLLVDVPLSQNQFDALVSFTYNVGTMALSRSTLLKKLNRGDHKGAVSLEFLRWNKAGGKVVQGLTNRRQAERKLFLT